MRADVPPPSSAAPASTRPRHRATGGLLLVGWLMMMGWAFWLLEGRPAYLRAQLASDPTRVAAIEAWAHSQVRTELGAPQLLLLPARCPCAEAASLRERLRLQAEHQGLIVADAAVDDRTAALLPDAAGALLLSPGGRLLFVGPLQSPIHCTDGRSLVELILPQAHGEAPPLWAPVIDEPCACRTSTFLA